ncbi:MAG: hypothetical protein R3257_04375 [bacterium]|nr:hypothetical protein [bacterium]
MKNLVKILILAGCIALGVHCGMGLPGEGGDWIGEGPFGGGGSAQPSLGDVGSDNEPPQPMEPVPGFEDTLIPNGGGEDPEEPNPEPTFEPPTDFTTP